MKPSASSRLSEDGKLLRTGRKRLLNGAIYEGELCDGLCEGIGEIRYRNGDRYVGEMQADKYHGHGTYCWSHGSDPNDKLALEDRGSFEDRLQRMLNINHPRMYEGEYNQGLQSGEGVLIFYNGTRYTGSFLSDEFHGTGKLSFDHGRSYIDGNWRVGRPFGTISICYGNGDCYSGEIRSGSFHGKGRVELTPNYFNDNNDDDDDDDKKKKKKKRLVHGTYTGDFQQGLLHGSGTRRYFDSSEFIGRFDCGVVTGDGEMKRCDGRIYAGRWSNGVLNGLGSYSDVNGVKMNGNWKNGLLNDENAEIVINNYSRYTGNVVNARRHGTGSISYDCGVEYTGDWSNNIVSGKGKTTTLHNFSYTGDYYNGMRHGYGEALFGNTNGDEFVCPLQVTHNGTGKCRYIGCWKCQYMDGLGEFSCGNGSCGYYYSGNWHDNLHSGHGLAIYNNHDKSSIYQTESYLGDWLAGVKHGAGIMTMYFCEQVIGRFVDGYADGVCEWRRLQTMVLPRRQVWDDSVDADDGEHSLEGCKLSIWVVVVSKDHSVQSIFDDDVHVSSSEYSACAEGRRQLSAKLFSKIIKRLKIDLNLKTVNRVWRVIHKTRAEYCKGYRKCWITN